MAHKGDSKGKRSSKGNKAAKRDVKVKDLEVGTARDGATKGGFGIDKILDGPFGRVLGKGPVPS